MKREKKKIIGICLALTAIAAAMYINDAYLKKRQVVIISTNDIHSSIDNFPRLATLVKQCRDTIETVLLDSGDRWTGGSYVDLAEGRRPILDLMGELGYNAVTLGNHEFDKGPRLLNDAIKYSSFRTVNCNLQSDTTALEDPDRFLTMRLKNGIKLFISGVVTNADNGHPDGAHRCFKSLRFTDPAESAHAILNHSRGCDMRILLSHMGNIKDCEYASAHNDYNLIIGGHTHTVLDTLLNGVVIGQTGLKLKRCGVTRISFRGRRIESIDYNNVDLADIPEDSVFKQHIARIKSNPELTRTIGVIKHKLDFAGIANMLTSVIRDTTNSDIGIYHYGGIRLAEIPAGNIPLHTTSDLEPFQSMIVILEMTPEQMRRMIKTKYNDTSNMKESHRIDLLSSIPYTIVTDSKNNAVDVIFPTLAAKKTYRVAITDYVANQYPGLEYKSRTDTEIAIVDALNNKLKNDSPLDYQCILKQRIVVKNTNN